MNSWLRHHDPLQYLWISALQSFFSNPYLFFVHFALPSLQNQMSFLSWPTIWAGQIRLSMAIPLFMKRRILNASLNGGCFSNGHTPPALSAPPPVRPCLPDFTPHEPDWPHPPVTLQANQSCDRVLNLIHPPTTNYSRSQKWTGSIQIIRILPKLLSKLAIIPLTLENGTWDGALSLHLIMALMSTSPIGMVPDRQAVMWHRGNSLISRRLTRENILKTAWQMRLIPTSKIGPQIKSHSI